MSNFYESQVMYGFYLGDVIYDALRDEINQMIDSGDIDYSTEKSIDRKYWFVGRYIDLTLVSKEDALILIMQAAKEFEETEICKKVKAEGIPVLVSCCINNY